MWSEATHAALGSDDPPEIKSADLAPLALVLASWGAGSERAPVVGPAPEGQLDAGLRDLLRRLGAIERDAKGSRRGHTRGATHGESRRCTRAWRAWCSGARAAGRRARGWRVRWRRCWGTGTCSADATRRRISDADSARCGTPTGKARVSSRPRPRHRRPAPAADARATPVRVPIGTKVDSGRKKRGKMKARRAARNPRGAAFPPPLAPHAPPPPRADRRPTPRPRSTRTRASRLTARRRGGWEGGGTTPRALGRLARSDADDAWRAPGVGARVIPRAQSSLSFSARAWTRSGRYWRWRTRIAWGFGRSGRGAFQLSGGSGAANVPDSGSAVSRGDFGGGGTLGDVAGGARGNDRARLAAPVPASALEPGGCLHEHLCETRDRVAWAVASKAVVARRLLAVGEAVLRETPYAPEPEDTVPAMLEGVRAMARAPLWVGRTTRKNGGGG